MPSPKRAYRVVFAGTPEFAVPTLTALHHSRHAIEAVVTQPDRPQGRGRQMRQSPVKSTATAYGYKIVQPESTRNNAFVTMLTDLAPDFLVVVAFGQILNAAVLAAPRIAPINVHASLLPKYRGAAPINWAIINGEKESGITTMWMDKGLDTGDILLAAKTPIAADETATTLHDRLSQMGAELLIETLDAFTADGAKRIVQDDRESSYAPMLKKNDGQIEWTLPAVVIQRRIRGMDPWPGTFSKHADNRIKIFRAKTLPDTVEAPPGTVVEGFADELRIATGEGLLLPQELQIAGGKRLVVDAFLRGYRIAPGDRLGI